MPYDRLAERLRTRAAPVMTTLPDGSVDKFCSLSAGAVGPLATRRSFAREVKDEARSTFHLRVESVEPGGQSVNVAQQVDALGAEVTCYGHLDHSVFEGMDFETVSMGDPAVVHAFNFEDSDVMFVEESSPGDWSLATLQSVADLDSVFAADAVCCSNWVSFPGLASAFHRLAELDLPRVPFLLDPGDIVGYDASSIDRLLRALGALQDSFDVVFNANRQEIHATAATLPDPPSTDRERLAAIREAAGIHAAVLHGREQAMVDTREGASAVNNLSVEHPQRHTGGGDRFTGGLGYGLANGWDVDVALACGNACAARYVETGATGDTDDLRAYLETANVRKA